MDSSSSSSEDRSEIAFFDLETTVPKWRGQGYAILEFGAILVCPKKLVELGHYSTLVRPADLSLISSLSIRCNGITPDAVVSAPSFADIADRVYDILHGRIWAGHNILRFDCKRIVEAFAAIGKTAPEPRGTIDSLALLTQKFGRRAGDMKMASLADYFGIGKQTHRSLDDVRMNLEVLKYCAAVLFLESSLPDIFTENSWVSPNANTRSHSNGKIPLNGTVLDMTSSSPSWKHKSVEVLSPSPGYGKAVEDHQVSSFLTPRLGEEASTPVQPYPFDMGQLRNEMKTVLLQADATMVEEAVVESPNISTTVDVSEGCSSYAGFLDPDEVSISHVSASFVPFCRGIQRIKLLHKDVNLQLSCTPLRVRFGISSKFMDQAGRPRLSFVVDATPSLCKVLEASDGIAQKLSSDSGSSSEWRSVVIRKPGFFNFPTVRLNIPTVVIGNVAMYASDIYQKDPCGTIKKLVFSKFDVAELEALFTPGTHVDASFSLDTYDYQQSAGIRLVAKKLIIHSN